MENIRIDLKEMGKREIELTQGEIFGLYVESVSILHREDLGKLLICCGDLDIENNGWGNQVLTTRHYYSGRMFLLCTGWRLIMIGGVLTDQRNNSILY